jgi:hypothetical protein
VGRLLRRRPPRAGRANSVAPATPPPRARLVARPELLCAIAELAAASRTHETGGPLLGTVQRSWADERLELIVAVLGTVPPGPALRGGVGSVALGRDRDGERAASALRWWRAVTSLELIHLGDWHKHPGGGSRPSPGDEMTAMRMSAESATPVWLTAIVAGEHTPRFYREAGRAGLEAVTVVVEREAIPGLPALPWHIVDSPRFAAECRLLHAAGITAKVGQASHDGRPAVRIRLHRDGSAPLTVVTGPRYPQEPPVALDERGRRLALPDGWSAERFLVDLMERA